MSRGNVDLQEYRTQSEKEKKNHSAVTEGIFAAEGNSNKRMRKLCKKKAKTKHNQGGLRECKGDSRV